MRSKEKAGPDSTEWYKFSASHPGTGAAAISLASTLALVYVLAKDKATVTKGKFQSRPRSTPLPGFGILGDRINEFLGIFLDALAVYVHNDSKWDCQRRLLCEANQRAGEYGIIQGILMYLTSLSVSLWLKGQKVSESMEAMRKGRYRVKASMCMDALDDCEGKCQHDELNQSYCFVSRGPLNHSCEHVSRVLWLLLTCYVHGKMRL